MDCFNEVSCLINQQIFLFPSKTLISLKNIFSDVLRQLKCFRSCGGRGKSQGILLICSKGRFALVNS